MKMYLNQWKEKFVLVVLWKKGLKIFTTSIPNVKSVIVTGV